jgi:soluble lytic murein transglycosylase-like protein
MSDFSSLFSATEQKYGLPPGILAATAQVESSGNPNAVSPKGALGLMQLMPTTAKGLGVDPHNPAQAIDGAGRVWAQNLKATGGDIDAAAMMYDAGPDRAKWNNPETQAYPGKLAAALGPAQPKGGDPIEAALSGQPAQSSSSSPQVDPNDPIETALSGGKGSNASVPSGSVGHGAGSANPQSGVPGNGVPDDGSGRDVLGASQGAQGGNQGAPPTGLQPHQLGVVPGILDAGLSGFTAGLVHPVTAALNTVIPFDKLTNPNVKSIWDTSLPAAFENNLAIERGGNEQFRSDHPVLSIAPDVIGAIASPFNKLFAPAEGAGFLRSIPNFVGQGIVYGGTRGYADTGDPKTAALAAALGGAVAPVGAAVGTVAGKTLGAALRARSTLANIIPQSERSAAADMIDAGASADQVVSAHPNLNPDEVAAWVGYRARGGKAPVSFSDGPPADAAADAAAPTADASSPDAPIVITGKKYAAALGTQGNRRGVESVTDLPPQVQADVARLQNAGVDPSEAQAEADILYVGGKPTVANVTRDPAEQRAMFEGAKQSTPEGAMLNDTIASNNQALHDTINNTVNDYGGVPAQGEAAESAAQALAQASDAQQAGVTAKYTAARAQDGDVKINTDALRELLQSPEMATPTNPQTQQLSNGISSFLNATDQRAGTTLRSPEEIEQIRQLANAAYDPMGGPVNNAVGKIGGALNDSLDQLDQASALWRAARAAHRDWASQYSDPAGVAKLIARDARGNFLNADQWRLSENGLISRLDDKPFAQVVGQLKNIGATDALNRLKAGIVQQAYERATNTARDQLGNPIVNGKLFQGELNKIGMPKLQALFSPDELAHIATIGRAARALNEAVPGTVNTSGTTSSLINALSANPGSHPLLKALRATKYVSAGAGHLHAAVVLHGAEHIGAGSAQRAIGQGIREQLNPGLARVQSARSASKISNAQFRAAMGRALRNRGAIPAADNDRIKAIGRRLSGAL